MSRKSRSVQAKTPGVLKIPLKLFDFPTNFPVFLVNSRNQAQKRKFLFSGRVKFCRPRTSDHSPPLRAHVKFNPSCDLWECLGVGSPGWQEGSLQNFTRSEKRNFLFGLDAWN